MRTIRVKPGFAVANVGLAEQTVAAYRRTVAVRWAGYIGDEDFAARLARRLDYALPHEFGTPPAQQRLTEAIVDTLLEPLRTDPDLRATALAAFALGGWDAAMAVIPGARGVVQNMRAAFWPKASADAF